MIHPTIEIVNFEIMEDARQPKTNRELMLQIGQQVRTLSESINRLTMQIEKIEEQKIKIILEEIDSIKQWRSEWNGTWKFWIIIGGASAIILGILNFLK